ncbi:hypothetical protein BD324DRAFT_610677 [Kockovaella imperatae]|uniref:Uncharacterized protein n=1 Tax=Kockovaella imperatae TaxID=4999 RepID=A0A1Y1U5N3_9TREE|nr:hypothetical protein BD324DRAFT_610677 [Kockovaella imperatae]ORX33343.1 hypothetical protein BD324DRAFT_610677 [Kockovaella imperatae]
MTACGFTVVPRSVEEWGVAPASGEWPAYGFKHPELVCKNRSGGPTVVHRLRSVAQFPPFLTLCLGACWGCTIEKTEDCSVDWVKGRVGGGLLPPRAKAQKRHLPGQEGSAAEAVVPDSSDNDGPRVGPADHTDVVPETPRKKQKGEDTTQNDHREGRQDNRSRPRPSMTLGMSIVASINIYPRALDPRAHSLPKADTLRQSKWSHAHFCQISSMA